MLRDNLFIINKDGDKVFIEEEKVRQMFEAVSSFNSNCNKDRNLKDGDNFKEISHNIDRDAYLVLGFMNDYNINIYAKIEALREFSYNESYFLYSNRKNGEGLLLDKVYKDLGIDKDTLDRIWLEDGQYEFGERTLDEIKEDWFSMWDKE